MELLNAEDLARVRRFQWSHGFSTMETRHARIHEREGYRWFQWSHGFSTMETPLDFYAYLAGLRGAISSTSWPPYKNYAILEPHRELHLA